MEELNEIQLTTVEYNVKFNKDINDIQILKKILIFDK